MPGRRGTASAATRTFAGTRRTAPPRWFRFRGRAKNWLVGAWLGVVVAPMLAACAGPSACEKAERADYPELERLAAEVLADADADDTVRIGSCDVSGQPSAAVVAEVSAWQARKQARDYLLARGWTPEPGRLLSPDGRYTALYVRMTQNKVVLGIEVRFYMAL
jgi:hypothetical protein